MTRLVERLREDPLPADTILNINVPDLPWSEIRGFEVTRLGYRHRAEPVVKMDDPRGRPMYWIGPAGKGQDAGPGTDFDAISRGFISITPIHVDLTRYQALEQVAGEAQLVVRPDRDVLARYGIPVAQVMDLVSDAIGGREAGRTFRRWFHVVSNVEEKVGRRRGRVLSRDRAREERRGHNRKIGTRPCACGVEESF